MLYLPETTPRVQYLPVMHERERYFDWFIVEFLASAALNDSKWALRSKLPITMLGRSRGRGGWKRRQSHVTETAPSHLLITFLAFSATNRVPAALKTFQTFAQELATL